MELAQAEARLARERHKCQELEQQHAQLQRSTSQKLAALEKENRELQMLNEELLTAGAGSGEGGCRRDQQETGVDEALVEEACLLRERVQALELELAEARSCGQATSSGRLREEGEELGGATATLEQLAALEAERAAWQEG